MSRGAPSNEWTARQPILVNTERLAAVLEKHAQAEGDVQAGLPPDLDPDYPLHKAGRFVAAFPLAGEENALALSRARRVDAIMVAAEAVREAAREVGDPQEMRDYYGFSEPVCEDFPTRSSPPSWQTRCGRCLELEQQVVTLRRTAERLSKQLVASSSKLVSEVARARAEGREEGRAAANEDEEAAREREGTGW